MQVHILGVKQATGEPANQQTPPGWDQAQIIDIRVYHSYIILYISLCGLNFIIYIIFLPLFVQTSLIVM